MKYIENPFELLEALGKYKSGHAATNTALKAAPATYTAKPLQLKASFEVLSTRHAEVPLNEEGQRLLLGVAAWFKTSGMFGLRGPASLVYGMLEPGLSEIEPPVEEGEAVDPPEAPSEPAGA